MTYVTINGKNYEAHPMTIGDKIRYWMLLREISNPYKELYDQVAELPQRLQDLVFKKCIKPHTRPLTRVQRDAAALTLDAVMFLARACMTEADLDLVAEAMGPGALTDSDLAAMYAGLYPLIGAKAQNTPEPVQAAPKAPANTERTLSGHEASEFLRQYRKHHPETTPETTPPTEEED